MIKIDIKTSNEGWKYGQIRYKNKIYYQFNYLITDDKQYYADVIKYVNSHLRTLIGKHV